MAKTILFENPVFISLSTVSDHPIGFWIVGGAAVYTALIVYSIAQEIVFQIIGILYPIFKSFEAM